MTREEMIRLAQETRDNMGPVVVPEEMMAEYPAEVTLKEIPTRVGISKVYDTVNAQVKPGGPLVINLHGGGFIRDRTANDELFCRKIAQALSCRVLDVDYRVAPEYPFPAALHECYDVVKWAFDHAEELAVDPSRVILMGHSAGGNLVCGVCMMAIESGEFKVPLAVLDYPPLDIYTDPADKKMMGEGIPYDRSRIFNLCYCDRELQNDPLVSPVFAEDSRIKGFPATLVITAERDDLCNEAEEFALKLARVGTEVTLKRFPGAGHGFTIKRESGYQESMELIIRFIRNFIG